MNINNLSFSALPPINVPFRYFISANIFVILAVILMLFTGQTLWASRWQPAMLAITHLFTLGFISMVIMGAIYQFLPVIGGVGLHKPQRVANIAHSLHVIGTLALAANFMWPSTVLQYSAVLVLAVGFAHYLSAVAQVLIKKLSRGYSIIGMTLALMCFVVVIVIGILLLIKTDLLISAQQGAPKIFSDAINQYLFIDKSATDLHALIGGFGWVTVFIIALSGQIIPLFHVTPKVPELITKFMPFAVVLLLLTLMLLGADGFAGQFIIGVILLLTCSYGLVLLNILSKRKRKVSDTNIQFWQFSSVSLVVISLLFFIPEPFYNSLLNNNKALLLAWMFGYFYIISIIQAMLLKIIPFLTYTHLQNLCLVNFSAMQYLPNMHELLVKKHGQLLFKLHLCSCFLFILSLVLPMSYWLLCSSILAEFCCLLFLMLRALHLYRQTLVKISKLSTELSTEMNTK